MNKSHNGLRWNMTCPGGKRISALRLGPIAEICFVKYTEMWSVESIFSPGEKKKILGKKKKKLGTLIGDDRQTSTLMSLTD